MSDRDFQQLLEETLADGPESAPMTSRAMIRGRLREVRQRPAWRVRERGDEYPRRRRNTQVRMLAIGVALVALLGISFAVGGLGSRPQTDDGPATPSVRAYPIDGQPLGIALADGDVWTALFNRPEVVRLDPETGQTTVIASFGRNCVSMSAGAGGVWVPSCIAAPLVRIDPATNEVTAITPSGQGQTGAPVFDGATAWLTLDVGTGTYALYDTRTQEEGVRRDLPGPGHMLEIGFASAWAAINPDGGPYRLLRLNLVDATETASISLAAYADLAAVTGDALWVSTIDEDAGRASLVRIDPATDEVAAVIDFEQPVVYPATDGSTVWVLGMGDATTIYRIDAANNTAIEVFALDGRSNALAVDGDTLWISRGDSRELVRIDLGG